MKSHLGMNYKQKIYIYISKSCEELRRVDTYTSIVSSLVSCGGDGRLASNSFHCSEKPASQIGRGREDERERGLNVMWVYELEIKYVTGLRLQKGLQKLLPVEIFSKSYQNYATGEISIW